MEEIEYDSGEPEGVEGAIADIRLFSLFPCVSAPATKKHREKAKTFSRCHSAAAISATKLDIFPYFIRIVIGESASAF